MPLIYLFFESITGFILTLYTANPALKKLTYDRDYFIRIILLVAI